MTTQHRGSPEPGRPAEGASLIGQLVDGRYRIVELVGEGGMGRVWRAEQLRLERSVAIKVLHPSCSAIPEVGRRFEREAIALARLDHPNCVAVQDFGRLPDGSLYLVMSYLKGALLKQALESGPFPVERALHVARHLLCGLAHAHRAGIVHRDIKPENVMLVAQEGDPDFAKIFDFGIVKLLTAEPPGAEQLTTVGQRFGTPAYMSPEQSLGREVDARTDLYSLTAVLYEMLTGRRVFTAPDDEGLLVMHAAKAPPSLAEAAGRPLPDDLEALVRHGLAKSPAERPSSAGDYLAALDACAKRLAAPAAAPSGGAPARPSRVRRALGRALRSRRALTTIGLLILLAAGALAIKSALTPDYAAHARSLLAAGRAQEAADYLQQHLEKIADDAQAQLELGNADSALRRYDEALVAYERVRSLDRSLADDRAMRTNLMLMLDDDRDETAIGAARFLIQLLGDEGAKARVVEIASHGRSPAHRAAMRGLAESLGLSGRVDLLASYRLDLAQGATCPDRRRAVAELRALRDPSASPALRKALTRKSNACLRDDATDAVRYLDSLGASEPASD